MNEVPLRRTACAGVAGYEFGLMFPTLSRKNLMRFCYYTELHYTGMLGKVQ